MNHLANGRSHSSVLVNGSSQSRRSRASRAQNSTGSASASAYRSGLALAWAENAASGGNLRFSARRFSIAADWDEVASALTDTPHGLSLARPSYRAVPGTDGRGSAGLIRPGVSISLASSAAIRRLRYSPAAAHWSEARTEPRIFRVTPCSLIASTRSTRGG